MNKLLFIISSIVILSTFNSCSSDEDEAEQQSINAQNQVKTITVELISELPIGPMASEGTQSRTDQMTLVSGGGATVLSNQVPNQIGENVIVQTFTALPLSNLGVQVQRFNFFSDYMTGEFIGYCGDVTINLYSDDELFQTVTKEMGGANVTAPCPDGNYYNFNFIVPE